MIKKLLENKMLKKLPLRLILLFAMVILSLYFFGRMIHEVFWEEEKIMDAAVAGYVNENMVHPALTKYMMFAADLASRNFLLVAYSILVCFYLFYKKNNLFAISIGLIGITGFFINHALKLLFKRVRPADQLIETLKNFSFPSGHSTSAFLFYGLLIYLLWKEKIKSSIKITLTIVLILIILLIGFSRIYLRVHYITDVIAGFSIGLAWLLVSIWLVEEFGERRKINTTT